MTAPIPAQIQALESSYDAPLRNERIAPPMTFLSLAPTTSASYPAQPLSASPPRSESIASTDIAAAASAAKSSTVIAAGVAAVGANSTAAGVIAEAMKNRRSSSSGSAESVGSKQRFLKLGPVHWGEDRDGKGDWADME